MAGKGPRPQYNDPKNLQSAIDGYFDSVEGSGDFPDYAGMLLYLRIYEDEVADLLNCEDEKKAMEYQRVFDYARLRRESFLSREAIRNPKAATGCYNMLKEEKNGGYSADTNKNKNKQLNLVVTGLKGGMDSFK